MKILNLSINIPIKSFLFAHIYKLIIFCNCIVIENEEERFDGTDDPKRETDQNSKRKRRRRRRRMNRRKKGKVIFHRERKGPNDPRYELLFAPCNLHRITIRLREYRPPVYVHRGQHQPSRVFQLASRKIVLLSSIQIAPELPERGHKISDICEPR